MKTLHRRLPDTNPFRILFFSVGFFITVVSSHITRVQLFVPAIILCLAISISATAQDNRGIFVSTERLALVIGNSAYQTAPLRNPVNDAEDMSTVLSGLGFNVTLKKNVDRRNFEDAIRQFGRQLKHGGVGLFYFAGHGMQVEGRNYLIPINTRIESESDIKYEAVDAGFVLGKMEDAENQLNIVILDACRSNPFARDFRSENRGLARMDAPTGSLIVYATAPGEVAADGPKRNGVFTRHLIKHMRTPNLPIEQVLKRVRIDVAAETKQRQIPWESSSLMGDFYFKIEKASTDSQSIGTEPKNGVLSSQKTDSMYSALPPSILTSPAVAIKKKLAIFPLYFSESRFPNQTNGIYDQNKKVAVSTIKELLFKDQDLVPTYSYYELTKYYNYKKIDPPIFNRKVEDELWIKSSGKPNVDFATQLARKIGADVIFLGNCELESIDLYLIDVSDNVVYFKEYIYKVSTGYSNIPNFIKDFFSNYNNYRIE